MSVIAKYFKGVMAYGDEPIIAIVVKCSDTGDNYVLLMEHYLTRTDYEREHRVCSRELLRNLQLVSFTLKWI